MLSVRDNKADGLSSNETVLMLLKLEDVELPSTELSNGSSEDIIVDESVALLSIVNVLSISELGELEISLVDESAILLSPVDVVKASELGAVDVALVESVIERERSETMSLALEIVGENV